ncbi:MAG: T9SS type A sorting domain-containing protein [Saprospiraceae bacterium]|nr:T9SS type A sorting domain-containing protein [Saprospiraceae bacterium]
MILCDRFNIKGAVMASLILFCNISKAQVNDFHWLMGYSEIIPMPDTLKEKYGTTRFDFNHDPVSIYRDDNILFSFSETNTSYADETGKLIAYSNGMNMYNRNNDIMEGGDSLVYGDYWELWNFKKYMPDGSDWQAGLNIPQGNLILDYPGQNKKLAIIQDKTYPPPQFNGASSLHLGLIDTEANDGLGKMTLKDSIFEYRKLNLGYIHAVKHANGRDWWVTSIDYNHRYIYVYLLSPKGIRFHHRHETGYSSMRDAYGQSCFSPDGSVYAYVALHVLGEDYHLWVYDFDRCTGNFSHQKHTYIEKSSFTTYRGMAISPNSRYLYAGSGYNLFQYDLSKEDLSASRTEVAVYDGFREYWSPTFSVPTYFGRWQIAPDGKLYSCSSMGSTFHFHRIEFPDETGVDCQVTQHAIRLPTRIAFGLPNFPNYRLGPLDGSPCDTLGIDNHPIAKYRYEPDTIDHLRIRFTDLSYFRPQTWSWDFGDGSPKENIRHPYHSYVASGTYNVCLTVSNENSSNTSCRTITIGTSSSDDVAVTPAGITLFPNPVQDYLLVTLGEYIPQRGQIMIYDISGRPVHTQRIYYGQNNVDMTHLATGMYVWKVMDGKVELRAGKVVKVE